MRVNDSGMMAVKRRRQINRRRPDRREQLREGVESVWALVRRSAPFALLAVIATGLPYLSYQAYMHTMSSGYFALETIELSGQKRVRDVQVLQAGQLEEGMNIFSVDAERSRALIEQLDYVKSAHVERRLPDRVSVRIEEYEPAAIVVDDGYMLVDAAGHGFLRLAAGTALESLLELPLISGIGHAELASERGRGLLTDALEVAELYESMGLGKLQRLSQIHVDAVMGISLVTEETGTEIRLGWGRYDERLERLKAVQSTLIERGMDADYVLVDQDGDLNRIAVGQRPEPGIGEGGGSH